MRKSNFKKMFAVMTFFITLVVVSIMNVSQVKAASITVTSPNGGEIWKVGETHRITWISDGVEKVTMYLYDDRILSSGAIVNYPVPDNQPVPASQGYYDWTILPNVLQANDGKNFTIIVQDASDYKLSGKSQAPFSIVATSTPYVTVLSPNGGETFEAGKGYAIKWKFEITNVSQSININLMKYSGGAIKDNITFVPLATNISNSGNYNVEIPLWIPAGKDYIIRIFNDVTKAIDESDAPFSITAAAPTATITSSVIVPALTPFTLSGVTSLPAGSYIYLEYGNNGGSGAAIVQSDGFWSFHYDSPGGLPAGSYSITLRSYSAIGTVIATGTLTIVPSITVLSPNGGETFTQGLQNTIKWTGGKNKVQVGLVKTDYNPDPATNKYYPTHWINLNAKPDSKIFWNGKTVTDSNGMILTDVALGAYKILLVSETPVGNYCMWSSQEKCNTDVSDAPFSIVAADSTIISEKVKCVFKGSPTEQKCYAAVDNNGLTCSGKESCVMDVTRAIGEKIIWKSSCGGYAYTTMDGTGGYDGRGEYAEFDCAIATTTTTPVSKPTESKVEIIEMKYNAKDIFDDKYDSILAELKQLRDTVKEQQTEIKYLKSMTSDLRNISDQMKSAINDFITYGVDANTVKLGAGERAAVINSYKAAFAKLPETEAELTDAIKIANGRFPSLVSDTAEKSAKEQFIKIYKRIADLNDAKDNAAIKVMAYGLRQKAENRNLNSEKSGINIFKNIYGFTPKTTQDWNTMQAITYSGAAREKDSDGDLLSDEMEAQYGTNPNKADSDGDGFKDGVEVNGGYNPKGEGKL